MYICTYVCHYSRILLAWLKLADSIPSNSLLAYLLSSLSSSYRRTFNVNIKCSEIVIVLTLTKSIASAVSLLIRPKKCNHDQQQNDTDQTNSPNLEESPQDTTMRRGSFPVVHELDADAAAGLVTIARPNIRKQS